MLGLSQRSVESFRLVSWDFGESGQFKQRDSTVFGLGSLACIRLVLFNT